MTNKGFKRGDRIRVTGDDILTGIMSLGPVVTGEVFAVNDQGAIIGFKCDQTGCMECVSDGHIELD